MKVKLVLFLAFSISIISSSYGQVNLSDELNAVQNDNYVNLVKNDAGNKRKTYLTYFIQSDFLPVIELENGKIIPIKYSGARKIYEGEKKTMYFVNSHEGSSVVAVKPDNYTGLSKTITKEDVPGNALYDLLIDSKKNIWMLTGSGLGKYNNHKWELVKSFDLNNYSRNKLFIDNNNDLWVLGKNIYRYNGSEWFDYDDKSGFDKLFSRCWVFNIYEKDSELYFGTYDGVNKYKDGQFFPLNQNIGLKANARHKVLHVENDVIWLLSQKTIKKQLIRVQDKNVQFFNTKGIASNYFTDPTNGQLYTEDNNKYYSFRNGVFKELNKPVILKSIDSNILSDNVNHQTATGASSTDTQWKITEYLNYHLITNNFTEGYKIAPVSKELVGSPRCIFYDSSGNVWVGFDSLIVKVEFK